MYRYDEDAVQPENGNKARYDPAAATEPCDRWVAAALEALELEANSKRCADDLFPEPYPSDPDEEKPSAAPVKPDVTTQPDAPDAELPKPAPARSTEVRSGDVDQPRHADNSSGNAPSHTAVWPYVSIVANVVLFTAAITAGMFHALSSEHGGRDNHDACLTALLATLLAYAVAAYTAASVATLVAPLCWFLMHWTYTRHRRSVSVRALLRLTLIIPNARRPCPARAPTRCIVCSTLSPKSTSFQRRAALRSC
eukprot:6202987-Pleurochrysis_carterae.AAC.2